MSKRKTKTQERIDAETRRLQAAAAGRAATNRSVGDRAREIENENRQPVVRTWLDDGISIDREELGLDVEDEIIADNFAGGGGASTGIELGLGRSPDIAVNHDDEAIAMHAANHPMTNHYTTSVWEVDPVVACAGKPVALAWFSPDCKHFSKSKGGKPREQKIRGLAWVAVTWAARVCPRVIVLENVEEFLDWGPLHRTHTHGCAGGVRERRKVRGGKVKTTETSECRKGCMFSKPIASRKGETFRAFVERLRKLGYVVEWKVLRASDYGAPTSRKRLFMIARRDGRAICWPEPTHGPGRAAPHRTAAEIIDWGIACPSIFDRERPLAEKTLARIARGIRKFVIEAAATGAGPFIVPTAHGGKDRRDLRVHPLDEPLRTVTGSSRGEHAIAVPYLVHRSNGERKGQAPRIYDVNKPIGTIVAQGQKHAACVAWLVKHYGGKEANAGGGSDLRRAIDTVTCQDHHSLATVHLAKFYGTSTGSPVSEPAPTITAGGGKLAQVVAFLTRYNGKGEPEAVSKPLGTLTTKDRYALATVEVDGETYAIVDIGMRMLTPRELFRAQGFPDGYRIDPPGPSGKKLTKTAQIRMCGNSVCPPLAAAIVRAQFQEAA